MRKYDLEERLIGYSVLLTEFSNQIPKNHAGYNLAYQLVRAGTSAALNYGEAQGAESRKDFIHKMRIILKELRESLVCLNIIERTNLYRTKEVLQVSKSEANQLITIFVKSIKTASKD